MSDRIDLWALAQQKEIGQGGSDRDAYHKLRDYARKLEEEGRALAFEEERLQTSVSEWQYKFEQLKVQYDSCQLVLATTQDRLKISEVLKGQLQVDAVAMRAGVERLRARVVMLLKCHYEDHKHGGSLTCFDVQAPSDEWENEVLARAKPR